MSIPTRSFTDIVRDMSAAITASAGRLIDMSVGSVLRAIIDANAGIVSWIQWTVLLVLQATRAATSSGPDLDSWMNDFGLSRLPALASSGRVTVSRLSSIATVFVPSGTVVKTQDGAISFSVTADASNAAWQPSLAAYALATGVTSVDLPITAVVAGSSGNVLPNTVTILSSPVAGIDVVNNVEAITGGQDPESDSAFRNRFTSFLAARSRATLDALGYAISTVGANLSFVIQENVDAAGSPRPGNILVVVSDGTGYISDSLMSALSVSLATVRPVGTTLSIQSASSVPVIISLSLECPPELVIPSAQSQVQSALENYVEGRPIGSTLSLTRISQLAYQTEPRIINISNVMLNGANIDLIAPPTGAFRSAGVVFT